VLGDLIMPDALELLTTRRSFKAVELRGRDAGIEAIGRDPVAALGEEAAAVDAEGVGGNGRISCPFAGAANDRSQTRPVRKREDDR
jgi:hypothetical protein